MVDFTVNLATLVTAVKFGTITVLSEKCAVKNFSFLHVLLFELSVIKIT